LSGSAVSGTVKRSPESTATGAAENRMYGRSLPHRVRVMSMMLPITGSRIASTIFETVMMTVTTASPAVLIPAYCSR
jgi:hypothetical protein